MKFFLKTGQKKMPWTSYFTVGFWLFGACHMWNYCFFYFPIDSQPPLTIFSHLLFFLKIQHIIFLRQVFLNESKKMPWTSYMVFGTSPLIPSLGWPYLDICSFFEIFRPSSSWVIYNLKGIKRDKIKLFDVKTFNIKHIFLRCVLSLLHCVTYYWSNFFVDKNHIDFVRAGIAHFAS